jgi:hypothetical protein
VSVPIPLATWLKLLVEAFETQTPLDNVVLEDTELTAVVDLEMLLLDGGALVEALSLVDPALALEGGGPDVTLFTQVGMPASSLCVLAKADALRLRL